jgi:hypothetical protein
MQTVGKQLAWISKQGIVNSYLNPYLPVLD